MRHGLISSAHALIMLLSNRNEVGGDTGTSRVSRLRGEGLRHVIRPSVALESPAT